MPICALSTRGRKNGGDASRGRPKVYEGKVVWGDLDLTRWHHAGEAGTTQANWKRASLFRAPHSTTSRSNASSKWLCSSNQRRQRQRRPRRKRRVTPFYSAAM